MLNKKNRISNKDVIKSLFAKGELYRDRFFIFKYKKATGCPSQFAVVVSKKVERKAVKRNRLRRQVYESLRLNLSSLKSIFTAVIIARPTLADQKISFQELDKSVKNFFSNLNKSYAE